MSVGLAKGIVAALELYFGVGVVFAIAFVVAGVSRVDPAAANGTWGFRLLILPGAAALWPWLLGRWVKGEGPAVEKNDHRAAAREGAR